MQYAALLVDKDGNETLETFKIKGDRPSQRVIDKASVVWEFKYENNTLIVRVLKNFFKTRYGDDDQQVDFRSSGL